VFVISLFVDVEHTTTYLSVAGGRLTSRTTLSTALSGQQRDSDVAMGHRCHLHPLVHNQSLISVIWLEFCGGGKARPGGQTNGSPVADASCSGRRRRRHQRARRAARASLTTVESRRPRRYDRASRKLLVLAIFVICVTQSEPHVTAHCQISYITSRTARPRGTFAPASTVLLSY